MAPALLVGDNLFANKFLYGFFLPFCSRKIFVLTYPQVPAATLAILLQGNHMIEFCELFSSGTIPMDYEKIGTLIKGGAGIYWSAAPRISLRDSIFFRFMKASISFKKATEAFGFR